MALREGCLFLENELIRVTFNARGEVTSLWDKETRARNDGRSGQPPVPVQRCPR